MAAAAAVRPDAAVVRRAIDVYVREAYPDGPPVTVKSMLAVQKGWAGDFFDAPPFVKDAVRNPTKYSLRLGNHAYPHMKLVYELAPDGSSFLFRADAHDAHCLPPADSPEYGPFRALMETNQAIIGRVEQAWAGEGIPTFKTYLKQDLERRRDPARVQ